MHIYLSMKDGAKGEELRDTLYNIAQSVAVGGVVFAQSFTIVAKPGSPEQEQLEAWTKLFENFKEDVNRLYEKYGGTV